MDNKGLYLKQVSFGFKPSALLFQNITVHLEPGKLHFVQGRNGTGKSTLFRILDGDVCATEYYSTGEYYIDNTVYRIVKNMVSDEYKSQVKHVVQDVKTMLIDQMTVQQNIAIATLSKYPSLKLFSSSIVEDPFLSDASIVLEQPVHTLSGGQKQLLSIIMSLHQEAKVLLLDEPTAALDDTNALLLMNSIQKLAIKRNLVVVIICHDIDISKQYCSGKMLTIKKEPNTPLRTIAIK